MSTFSGFRQDLFLVTIFPATEKILSEATDVAGIHRSFFAKAASVGNLSSFFLHHYNGFKLWSKAGSWLKYSISLVIVKSTASLESPSRKSIAVCFFFGAGGSVTVGLESSKEFSSFKAINHLISSDLPLFFT